MTIQEQFILLKREAIGKDFSHLNDMQKQAVYQVEGPLLVLSGAGSGKTTIIVNRIANLIRYGNGYYEENVPLSITREDCDFLAGYIKNAAPSDYERQRAVSLCASFPVSPYNIIAITFTNKAANELKERLSSMLGENVAQNIWAGTFHWACVRILRRDIDRLGYNRSFTIYDSDDSQKMISRCVKERNIDEKRFPPRMVLGQISKAKNELLTAEDFVSKYGESDYRFKVIGELYRMYEDRLKGANALDFDDIIMQTVFLLRREKEVLSYYQRKFKYILVDEYQDTNHSQYALVSLLAGGHGNICVVGDDDQSIYAFRGADITNILSFEEQFQDAKVIRLEQNYRSTKCILEAANRVIEKNTARKPKNLWTQNGEGKKITLYTGYDDQAEALFIADTILDKVQKEGKRYNDFAVLYRMNAQSRMLESTFAKSGIPHRVIGSMRFYDRKEIKDVMSYLALIVNHSDDLRLGRIINEPKRGIGQTTLDLVSAIAASVGKSIFEVCAVSDEIEPLRKASGRLKDFCGMIEELTGKMDTMDLRDYIELVMRRTGYLPALEAQDNFEAKNRIENLYELLSNAAAYEKSSEGGGLEGFLEEVTLISSIDNFDANADAVSLMTVHSAKGLEFTTVFIYGAEENIFPSALSATDPKELEEERRLFYVAITRSRESLYITNAKERMLYGKTTYGRLSRFAADIPLKILEPAGAKTYGKPPKNIVFEGTPGRKPVSSMFSQEQKARPAESYSVGEMVEHQTFGRGMVISAKIMANDIFLEVAFDRMGTKKLMANFAKLKKIR